MCNNPSIVIAIITRRRVTSLARTLTSLQNLLLPEGVNVKIVVVDNDAEQSAKETVASAAASSHIPIAYEVEEQSGIPYARNRVLECAQQEDYVAFIDDDDTANSRWLVALYGTMLHYQADVVKGRIEYIFDAEHQHLSQLDVFADSSAKTGEKVESVWTNNVLFSTRIYCGHGLRFDPVFAPTGGSDHHFFALAAMHGAKMVACRESIVKTHVPAERTTWKWLARRHMRIGAMLTLSERKKTTSFWQSLHCVLGALVDSGGYMFRLFRRAAKGHAPFIHPVMVGCFMVGRIIGLLSVSPREYVSQSKYGM